MCQIINSSDYICGSDIQLGLKVLFSRDALLPMQDELLS